VITLLLALNRVANWVLLKQLTQHVLDADNGEVDEHLAKNCVSEKVTNASDSNFPE
jgi:hypothetical protein